MTTNATQGRQRSTSNASSRGITRQPKQVFEPKSTHTSDEFLQDFLNPSFDPTSYLNAALPPLAIRSSASASSDAVSLTDLSSKAQTLISQLDAQTIRLSDTLTQLTDDILKSGSRLAYQVELLRGDALSLGESLSETLKDDIKLFVPGGLKLEGEGGKDETSPGDDGEKSDEKAAKGDKPEPGPVEPEFITQLKTLTLVRERLESVIKTFGNAMDFVLPPSEVSVSSGFLSVSAPDPGSGEQSSEEKGQKVLKSLREEIQNLLDNKQDPIVGVEQAAARVEELKELCTVWKGTAEEKGRNKFIDGLAKMVEDKHREVVKEMESKRIPPVSRQRSASLVKDNASATEEARATPGGFGLINQLQKLRGGL